MATFARGVEPGVFTQVELEAVPQVLPTTFVTALVGTTSLNKSTSKTMLRNSADAFTVAVNTDGTIAAGVANTDETIRRDYLDEYLNVTKDASSNLLVSAIVDSIGITHLKGEGFDWVVWPAGITDTDDVFVEWAARYVSRNTTITDEYFANGAGSGAPVEIARVSAESTFTEQTAPITSVDAAQDLILLNTVGTYSLQWGGGAAQDIVFTTGFGELTLIDTATNQIKIRADEAKITALGLLTTESYTNTITVSTSGPTAANSTTAGTYDSATHGTQYATTYQTPKDATDIAAVTYDNITDLQTAHGALTSSTSTEALSLGAVPYFKMGGAPVITMPLRDISIDATNGFDLTNDGGFVSAVEDALLTLEDEASVTMVIVLSPTETGVFRQGIIGTVKSHVLKMSSLTERQPRMAILGARANTTSQQVFIDNARAVANNNMIYLAPATAPLTTGGFTYTCDGSNIAAAVAGVHSDPNVDAGAPMEVQITAFDDIPDPFTRTQKNRIGELNGVTIIEKKSGTPKIRHYLSTDLTTSLTSEGKVGRITIDIRKTLQESLEGVMVNKRFIGAQTIATARSLIGLILTQKVNAEIIVDYRITLLERNAAEPRQLDVQVSVLPVFNLNWIFIKTTFKASEL